MVHRLLPVGCGLLTGPEGPEGAQGIRIDRATCHRAEAAHRKAGVMVSYVGAPTSSPTSSPSSPIPMLNSFPKMAPWPTPGRGRAWPGGVATTRRALFALVLLAGVLLRFGGLSGKLVWHDEVFTRLFVAGQESGGWFESLYAGDPLPVAEVQALQRTRSGSTLADTARGLAVDEPQHPPAYYLLARLWVELFGDGIGTLRVLSVLLSLLGFPALWWLARELCWARRVAWTALALLAFSPFFLLYAQEAREYALWSVGTLAATAALLRALRCATPGGWALYAGLIAGCCYTSFSSAAVLGAHGLFMLWQARGRPTRHALAFAGAAGAALLLFSPWILALRTHWEAFSASMAWSGAVVIPRAELLAELARNASRVVLDLGALGAGVLPWVGVAVAAVLLAVAVLALPRTAPGGAEALILCLIGVPLALLLGPDLLFGGIRSLSARYLAPAWLGGLLALAFLLAREERWARRLRVGVLALAGLSCVLDARDPTPWTKAVSVSLPAVAAEINAAETPLVLANEERHNPGNMLALSLLLRPDARMQFLRYGLSPRLGPEDRAVFLFSPTLPFREALESETGGTCRLLVRDVHLELWRLERGPRAGGGGHPQKHPRGEEDRDRNGLDVVLADHGGQPAHGVQFGVGPGTAVEGGELAVQRRRGVHGVLAHPAFGIGGRAVAVVHGHEVHAVQLHTAPCPAALARSALRCARHGNLGRTRAAGAAGGMASVGR